MNLNFCYTYSKLRDYEKCGFQHYHTSILKKPGLEPSGDAIEYGNRVHAALKSALKGSPLDPRMRHLQYWVNWFERIPAHQTFIEEKWALDRHYQRTEYYGKPWLRYNVDAAKVFGPLGYLVDWKTGKRLEEPLQLWLGAVVMFAYFPDLRHIESMFVWLKYDDGTNSNECISTEVIKRKDAGDIWESLLPRINAYEDAIATNTFVPSPGDHCRFCRVQACEHFGKWSL